MLATDVVVDETDSESKYRLEMGLVRRRRREEVTERASCHHGLPLPRWIGKLETCPTTSSAQMSRKIEANSSLATPELSTARARDHHADHLQLATKCRPPPARYCWAFFAIKAS